MTVGQSKARLITAQGLLTLHAIGMGISSNHTCKNSRDKGLKETLKHLICFCPTLVKTRRRFLGASQFKDRKEVFILNIKALLSFATSYTTIISDRNRGVLPSHIDLGKESSVFQISSKSSHEYQIASRSTSRKVKLFTCLSRQRAPYVFQQSATGTIMGRLRAYFQKKKTSPYINPGKEPPTYVPPWNKF